MRILAKTKGMTHAEWLEIRRQGIGGSDAAAIAGMSPWKSAYSVYMDKIGLGIPVEDNERMRIGRDLEDYVAKRFTEATGLRLMRRNAVLQHDEHDFIIGNIDRKVVGQRVGYEGKVTNSYAAKHWQDDRIPIAYELQCHHYMLVTGYVGWWIAVLVGNERFVYKYIERDEEVIDWLQALEVTFWNDHVLSGEEPAPDGKEDVTELIREHHMDIQTGKTIELVGMNSAVKRLIELKAYIPSMEQEQKALEQQLIISMGDAEYATTNNYYIKRSIIEYKRFGNKKFRSENPEQVLGYMTEIAFNKLTIEEV